VTFDEAQELQVHGRYSDLLRAAVAEQARARERSRPADQVRWTLWIVKACRYIGRTVEGLAHARHAVREAEAVGDAELLAEAVYAEALMFKVAGKREEGLAALDRAISMLPADAPALDRAVFELERAELAWEAGRREEARAALLRGGAEVHWVGNARLLAWALYLRATIEDDGTRDLQLSSALHIARTEDCPELEWQILWRLSEAAGRRGMGDSEADLARRAMSVLRRTAQGLRPEDFDAFWRQGARAAFVEWGVRRFGPAWREQIVLGPATIRGDGDEVWDPALLPEFVRAAIRGN
jgi:tetratricopeptide (TPR) repeat protein